MSQYKSLVGGMDTGFYVCFWFGLRLLGQNLIEYSLGDQGLVIFFGFVCLINLSFNLNGEKKF